MYPRYVKSYNSAQRVNVNMSHRYTVL